MLRLFLALLLLLAAGMGEAAETPRYFVHVTDQHLEWQYREGVDPAYNWCRNGPAGSSGKYGDVLCHSPFALLRAQLAEMKRLFPAPQFVLATGDFRRGFETVGGREEVLVNIDNVTALIEQTYGPDVPVNPVFGNHDVHPNNLHAPNNTWLHEYAAKRWAKWLPASACETLSRGGFYEVVADDYWIVGLNTCFYINADTATVGMDDPAGQFAWLKKTLAQAKTRGRKAYVIQHCIPHPGDVQQSFLEAWSAILRENADAIEANFYGHSHVDFPVLVFSPPGYRAAGAAPVGVGYVAPSVATRPGGPHGHNPAFRVFYREDKGTLLLSHETYYLDLEKANKEKKAVFSREYGTTDNTVPDLHMDAPMSPSSWSSLLDRVAANKTSFTEFRSRWAVRSITKADTCDEKCVRSLLCLIRYGADAAGYHTCIEKGL